MRMTRPFIMFLLLSFTVTSYAQDVSVDEYVMYEMTDEDWAYRAFRLRKTVPPYGLTKVQKLIKEIKTKDDYDDGAVFAIPMDKFNALSGNEKFTYVMIHPEVFAQNCDIMMPSPNEDKKIFGHLMSWGDEHSWSDRQLLFLRENRTLVMYLIKESTDRSKHMGVNYKDALLEINAWDFIPFLIKYYESNRKDKDVLTVLLQLMRKGEFEPFMKSTSFQKLYSSDYNYESYLDFNKANEALIIERANNYYKQKNK